MDSHSAQTGRFQRVEALFHLALESPASERATLLAASCQNDPALLAEVSSLIEAFSEQQSASHSASAAAGSPPARPIGPYAIDRLLGRGGMGAVYLAHRADGQFEQRVAIKLIDLPLAGEILEDRFRQERQILAGLQHPFIARFLDAGVTPEGTLYLVMEYVEGEPIDAFAERNHLSTDDRIALFLRVCEAVQFAHQNFVVHRDLKPDNIFVVHDGTPRLLDFGTAKFLAHAPESIAGQLTRTGILSFTPQYASPEQVLGTPVSAASDTYSLGVLLYLLLTGSFPYELSEFSTAELVRVVCQEPPRRPQPAPGSGLRLDADLEAILLKSLRKDPAERYPTVEQLAADLRAWTQGRPVAARRGNLRYRTQKFVRRHRIGFLTSLLLALTLAAGIAGDVYRRLGEKNYFHAAQAVTPASLIASQICCDR